MHGKRSLFEDSVGRFVSVHKYFLVVFAVLAYDFVRLVPLTPAYFHSYAVTPYVLSYKYGFGPRLFIGSVVDLFTDYVSGVFIWLFVAVFALVLIVMCSALAELLIRRSEDNLRPVLIFTIALFLASPASVSYLFNTWNYGRTDIYLLLISLAILLSIKSKRGMWIVPALCFCAMGIHEIYAFTYMPLILMVMLYELIHKRSRNLIAVCAVSVLVLCVSFIYFQLAAHVFAFESTEEAIAAISMKTDITLNRKMIHNTFFLPLSGHIAGIVLPALPLQLLTGGITIVLIGPLIVWFAHVWKSCIGCSTVHRTKWVFRMTLLLPLCALPAFVSGVDWGRWMAAILINQFALLLYYLHSRESTVCSVMLNVGAWLRRNVFLAVMLLVYMCSISKFTSSMMMDDADKITSAVYEVLRQLGLG